MTGHTESYDEAFWGRFFYDLQREPMKLSFEHDHAVNALMVSQQPGISVMNSYVSMRLLRYSLGEVEGWKRRESRKRDSVLDAPEIH